MGWQHLHKMQSHQVYIYNHCQHIYKYKIYKIIIFTNALISWKHCSYNDLSSYKMFWTGKTHWQRTTTTEPSTELQRSSSTPSSMPLHRFPWQACSSHHIILIMYLSNWTKITTNTAMLSQTFSFIFITFKLDLVDENGCLSGMGWPPHSWRHLRAQVSQDLISVS